MATCYAALVSLQTTIHSILNHPNPPIALDYDHAQALLQKSASLQNFLEHHSHRADYPTDDLKNKIRDAVYAAEDLIEKSTVRGSSVRLVLQRAAECEIPFDADTDEFWMKRIMEENKLGISIAIQDMDAIIKEITEEDKKKPEDLHLVSSISSLSLASPSAGKKSATVEFDVLNELWNMLASKPKSSRQIIPITGMGGIGKTTLATQAYQRDSQDKHFDVRVFVTISQKFKEGEFLQDILGQLHGNKIMENTYCDNEQMRVKIYQHLIGRRYLIILDDVWSIDDELSRIIGTYFPPDEKNGSRIVVTTRVSSVGGQLSNNSSGIQMNPLDDNQSWKLFSETVFKGEVCPSELEGIGKKIARNCGGLPLSIVVVGGFLAKSQKTKHYWEYVARDLSSIVKSKDTELSGEYRDNCLNILHLSYKHLPIHLKPCFLYMGILANDARTTLARLVELLVAEGFLKPISNKIMEVVAREYIGELADRNLISIIESRAIEKRSGKIQYCRIHDVVRDLCKREARREKFLYFVGENELDHNDNTERGKCKSRDGDISGERRIVVERKKVGTNFLSTAKKEFLKTEKGEFLTMADENGLDVAKESISYSLKMLNSGLGEETVNKVKEEVFLSAFNEEFLNTVKGEEFLNTIEEEFLAECIKKFLKFIELQGLIQEKEKELEEEEIHKMLEEERLYMEWLYMVKDMEFHKKAKLIACLHSLIINIGREKILEMLQSAADEAASDAKHILQSASNARSLISHFKEGSFLPPSKSCLLRVIKLVDRSSWPKITIEGDFGEDIIQNLFNSRYVAVGIDGKDYSSGLFIVPSSISLLWNLETLILNGMSDRVAVYAPTEIWKMPHLKHLNVYPGVLLPDPLDDDDELVLGKLQTLSLVFNMDGHSQWIKKISNIRKLRCTDGASTNNSGLSNLQGLDKMESLWLHMYLLPPRVKQNITFPQSLRKLTFWTSKHDWQDVNTMIGGALPNLEKLILREIRGTEWILTQEGQFPHLKVLRIDEPYELKRWTADDGHIPFPRLEYLFLKSLRDLEKIPSSIGDALNLQTIVMYDCSDASVISANKIAAHVEANEGSELLLNVTPCGTIEELKRISTLKGVVVDGGRIEIKEMKAREKEQSGSAAK